MRCRGPGSPRSPTAPRAKKVRLRAVPKMRSRRRRFAFFSSALALSRLLLHDCLLSMYEAAVRHEREAQASSGPSVWVQDGLDSQNVQSMSMSSTRKGDDRLSATCQPFSIVSENDCVLPCFSSSQCMASSGSCSVCCCAKRNLSTSHRTPLQRLSGFL